MSYCRWSTDNFACDLYCYADVSGGWTTHVASSRYKGDIPKTDWSLREGETDETWSIRLAAEYKAQHEYLMACGQEIIDLPFAGETFNDRTLEDFLVRLRTLRALGYQFPDDVIQMVEEEIADG